MTQIPKAYLARVVLERNNQPVEVLSGSCNDSQRRWGAIKKEALSIIEATEKLRHFLWSTQEFHHFSDHRNLVYVSNPTANDNDLKRHTVNHLYRWAMKLCSFRFTIEHIPGQANIWADILSRWRHPINAGRPGSNFGTQKTAQSPSSKRCSLAIPHGDPAIPRLGYHQTSECAIRP